MTTISEALRRAGWRTFESRPAHSTNRRGRGRANYVWRRLWSERARLPQQFADSSKILREFCAPSVLSGVQFTQSPSSDGRSFPSPAGSTSILESKGVVRPSVRPRSVRMGPFTNNVRKNLGFLDPLPLVAVQLTYHISSIVCF